MIIFFKSSILFGESKKFVSYKFSQPKAYLEPGWIQSCFFFFFNGWKPLTIFRKEAPSYVFPLGSKYGSISIMHFNLMLVKIFGIKSTKSPQVLWFPKCCIFMTGDSSPNCSTLIREKHICRKALHFSYRKSVQIYL